MSRLRVLEIGEHRLMREAFALTDHWSTRAPEHVESDGAHERRVTIAALRELSRAIASSDYDLIVAQPNGFAPWQWQAIARGIFRRSALQGRFAYARYLGQQMLRGRHQAPLAIWDPEDGPVIARQNVFLLDRATLYFKRELPPDHWRVFTGSLSRSTPTPRFRGKPHQRRRIAKVRPISLGLPLGRDRLDAAQPIPPGEKTADIFFTGRVKGSSTVRERGLGELLALRERGLRVDIPDNNLPLDEYLRRCASAWLTWSPEGYGYECFRTYEAALCGSVAVVNRPTVDCYRPLLCGEHLFHYPVEPGGLTATIEHALADKARLTRMAQAARAFVLAEHTQAALARYVARTTLEQAGRPSGIL
jgi:hypothetical protein